MGYLFNIIQFSFGSLIWGILIALACMALFVFIIKGWWKNAMFTIWSYLIGSILFLMLSFQCTMIVGSLKIINTCDEYEAYFTSVVNSMYDGWEEVSQESADIVINKAIAEFPLLEYYISGGEFSGYNAKQIPAAMADELRSFMWAYITRRLLWCLGFVIVAGVIGIMTLNKYNRSTRTYGTNNRERITATRPRVSGTTSRPRINTHRR